ncbi:hypothetical protein LTR66_013132 [Elasticomyces elasticus]|nr:hypothetical protein LTR66_013132 [Elasticomyces elasticus]
MSEVHREGRVVPAQLSFLAIYNPSLGPTDETFREQIVFYYSRAANEARIKSKGHDKGDVREQELREEENEKLRQVGLAQGMVDFARSFSDDEPVDSVETQKSRVVMRELDKGWWILASIDLTRLPATSQTLRQVSEPDPASRVEYSAREVSPPALLLQQLLRAHSIFLLHHGPSLSDLYVRLTRVKFCGALERFWTRFARDWDVLLHGNPAVDVFGGLKLASGGELGVGVGEEDWGSGEREVLEDLTNRTEGLVDLMVSRFGEPSPSETANVKSGHGADVLAGSQHEALPWMGRGRHPASHDGVVFSGTGAITRPSLRDISNWMQHVYAYGEYAYGVRDNPLRERRKCRRQKSPSAHRSEQRVESRSKSNGSLSSESTRPDADPVHLVQRRPAYENEERGGEVKKSSDVLPDRPRTQGHTASHVYATDMPRPQKPSHSRVPPPIASAAEKSLTKVAAGAEATVGPEQEDSEHPKADSTGSETWIKYLTLGYGSSWGGYGKKATPPSSHGTSTSSSKALRPRNSRGDTKTTPRLDDVEEEPILRVLDPEPLDHSLAAKLAFQYQQENKGHFVIGLTGDLDEVPKEEDEGNATDNSIVSENGGSRTLLRTIQVELSQQPTRAEDDDSGARIHRHSSVTSTENSAASTGRLQRLRVLVYVRRPFIYTFLFEQRTPALSMPSFYHTMHRHLLPLHHALLSSTSVAKVAQRIALSHTVPPQPESLNPNAPPYTPPKNSPIFDLVYDPRTLAVHTSIPDIPDPGTPAAEGIGTTSNGKDAPPPWTRVEALNVHTQVLNTLASTARAPQDIERTCKTSRGWWVVWMRIPPSSPSAEGYTDGADDSRLAFLVRKSSDAVASSNMGSRAGSGMFGLGRSVSGQTGGAAAGWGPAALASGIGVDARRYVEGLLSLNR